MGDNGTVWLPEVVSTVASEVDALFYFVLWVSTLIFVSVVGVMVYFAFKFRRRNADDCPEAFHISKTMELAWVILPTILCLIVFTWGFKVYVKLYTAPPDAYEIQVRASQWRWDYVYPNGVTTSRDLHVPVDRPVRLVMSSEDVLHSFFVPVFRVKQDILPDRYTSLWFQATNTGEFDIFCTEYCGQQHSQMLGKVIVESERAFNTWLNAQNEDVPPEELGARLYTQLNCHVCHTTDGTRLVGPTLKGLFGKMEQLDDGSSQLVDENYLLESILDPGAKIVATYPPGMPATYGTLTAKQLDGLIAFIKAQQ